MQVAGHDPLTTANRGRCKLEGDDFEEALSDFQEARTMGLEENFLTVNIALTLIELDRPAEALAEPQAAVALDPTDAWAQYSLVDSLVAMGDLDGALAAVRAAEASLSTVDQLSITNNMSWALYLAGRHEEGLAVLEDWMSDGGATLEHGDPDLMDTYAHLLAVMAQPEQAAAAFLKAVEFDPLRGPRFAARLAELGFGPSLSDRALRACAATGTGCRLSD